MKVSGFTGAVYFIICIATLVRSSSSTTPCALRATPYGFVCVCNVTYCDYLDPMYPSGADGFVLTSSSKMGLRFSQKMGKFSDKLVTVKDWAGTNHNFHEPMVLQAGERLKMARFPSRATVETRPVTIKVNRTRKFQKIVGFGGAFTGAVSYNLERIPKELQDAVYQSFYSKKGIAFSLMRIPIGGSDFDLEPWAYNELPEYDETLSNFTRLDYRDEKKIEQIKRLKAVANIENLKIMGTAWSPPKWMKSNQEWSGLSFLKKKYYQTWADYHLRFLELMDAKNVPIWAITTGNEPLNGIVGWVFVHFMSLGWLPGDQAVWLADNLGPTIRNSKFKNVKIFSNDDQRYSYAFWFKAMNETRSDSLKFLDGLAVHWYWDQYFGPSLIDDVHDLMPDKLILNTESCVGDKPLTTHGPELGSWKRAEKYANSYFEDLQHSFNGYIDWNLMLDESGGPSYVNNTVDASVIVNTTSGEEIYKQPMFYVMGHFSKFIPEGSIRIEAERSSINIVTVAFERPNGTISCIFFNSARAEVVVTLADSVRGNIDITIPPKSLHTIEYN